MSMIDHDHIDDLRARSEAERDARRYRRNSDGTVWHVRVEPRSSDGPYILGADRDQRERTLTVSAAELARGFVRCDGGPGTPSPMPHIPRPEELLPPPVDHGPAIVERVKDAVAQLTASKGRTATIADVVPVLNGFADAMRAAGWSVNVVVNRDGETGNAYVSPPITVDPKLFR